MSSFFEVGVIRKPHGYHGAFLISSKSDILFETDEIGILKETGSEPVFHPIQEKSLTPKGWLIRLDAIKSDAEVKLITGKPIFVHKAVLPELKQNEFYIGDLLNYEARETHTNQFLGHLVGIEKIAEGSIDRWWIRNEKDQFAVLGHKGFIEKIDTENKIVYLKNLSELQ